MVGEGGRGAVWGRGWPVAIVEQIALVENLSNATEKYMREIL